MEFINQYSMFWSAGIVLILSAFYLFRKGFQLQKALVLVGSAARETCWAPWNQANGLISSLWLAIPWKICALWIPFYMLLRMVK